MYAFLVSCPRFWACKKCHIVNVRTQAVVVFQRDTQESSLFHDLQENDRQMCSGEKDKTKWDLLTLSTSSSLTCVTLLVGGRSVPQSVPIAPGSGVNWRCYLIVQPATTMVGLNRCIPAGNKKAPQLRGFFQGSSSWT